MNRAESKYFNTALKFDEALLFLLEKKPFEYITVSEICQTAGLNRSTFYLHYENTCDLLEEATRGLMERFFACFTTDEQGILSRCTTCDTKELNFINEKYLIPYLLFIKENRRVFATVLAQPGLFKADIIFDRLFDNVFEPILDRFHYPQSERRYVMMFYLNGLTAVITQWLNDGCAKSPEETAQIIQHCIFGWDFAAQHG